MKNSEEKSLIFLKEPNSSSVLVFTESSFECMKYSDTYNNYGQHQDFEGADEYNVKAHNYFNGHNYRSIVIESEMFDTHEVVTDEDEIEQYKNAYNTKEWVSERYGLVNYESGEFEITVSHFASDPALATITRFSDIPNLD